MTKSLFQVLVLAAALACVAFPAFSQISSMDYVGFGWVDNGPVKAVGDEFRFVGVADYVDPEFGVDLAADELTFHVYGMLVASELDLGFMTIVTYAGGYLEIYQDSAQNADWGTNPPNLTVPGTFVDGTLFFSGGFTNMTMYFQSDGTGSFEGNLNGIAGTMIDTSCTGCVYTWGGAFNTDSNAQIPEGYTLQVDGVLEIDAAVAVEPATWDSVKALFSN